MSTEERRSPGATRIPFDALVEVGGALGPTFEAQAVNVSGDGIQLRTAYLPEPGQPLTCRFDAGPNHSVLAAGEVVWAQGADRGGEFGVRFTDVDAESVDALKRVCGLIANPPGPAAAAGGKVRLHIEGLAAPMRAKIKDAHASAVTVGSDLGFLQVGRQVELEDAQSGGKRPANIDRVEVAIDPTSQVPQLVVTLRYADMPDGPRPGGGMDAVAPSQDLPTRPVPRTDDLEAAEQTSAHMKGLLARELSRVGPAVRQFAERAKNTLAILSRRRSERWTESSSTRRAQRTTAPAPGGGLHAPGRRVLRGQSSAAAVETPATPSKMPMTRRRVALAGGVMIAAILGALALKKMHHESPQDTAAAAASASVAAPASPPVVASAAPIAPPPPDSTATAAAPSANPVASNDETDPPHRKHVRVAPFGNGPVHHGNILRLKMDGPVETIEGAQQPTGFAVKIPGRKSVEAAAPLAARDSRIAAIKVSNDSAGAELTVAFKDGVPNYRVSAKGDTLVIALAPPGATEATVAKKDESGGRSAKHTHAHETHEKKKSEEEL